jgi:aryl-alcohol dehydrogenase-like predicted oxidoreductase
MGCEPLGGDDWGSADVQRGRDAVRCALDSGITVFDTADVYGLGRGEEELSRALGDDRHRVTIITKGGVRWSERGADGRAPTRKDASAAYLSSAIDASLQRLRLDTIPLYLVHWPDPATPLAETIDCLERARDMGKIAQYGLSNFTFDAVRDAAAAYDVSAFEGELSLLSTEPRLAEFAAARALGLATLIYGVLAQGLLTGKYSPATVFDRSDRRHRLEHFSSEGYARNRDVLTTLADVARETGRSVAQVAIRWVLDAGVADSVIVGARSPDQVLQNVGALSSALATVDIDRLNAARRRAGLVSSDAPQ